MHAPAPELELLLADESATSALAGALAECLGPGFVLTLSGDLGAGKTTLARGLLRALGHTGRVRSPTFTLAESYNLPKFDLYHFDFYRFSASDEWRDLGFDELLGGAGAAVVEWPEMAGDSMPAPDLALRLELPDDEGASPTCRHARLRAGTDRGRQCLTAIAQASGSGRLAGVSSREGSSAAPSH